MTPIVPCDFRCKVTVGFEKSVQPVHCLSRCETVLVCLHIPSMAGRRYSLAKCTYNLIPLKDR